MLGIFRRGNLIRTNILILCIFVIGVYMVFFDGPTKKLKPDDLIDLEEIERELETGLPVKIVSFDSVFNIKSTTGDSEISIPKKSNTKRTAKYHALWSWADKNINQKEMFPDDYDISAILKALETAPIVHVDILDTTVYESGTSEKWVVVLEGGQKTMMKLVWEEKGTMKKDAQCNYGYEMPTSEIAAFHLHRILGFRNTPYVTGRKVSLLEEILPVATPAVSRQIFIQSGNKTCVVGKCYFCKKSDTMCQPGGRVEASVAYWVPRKLQLHTYPPDYMPYSTPMRKHWGKVPFNNRTYCNKLKDIKPYDKTRYYLDIFDFSVLDTLMYHFDSKHYTINDGSTADGATVRLDHGRTFCAYDRDEIDIFMSPLTQCCTLRRSTYEKLITVRGGLLSTRLRQALSKDPIAPILDDVWYPVLDRRLQIILNMIDKCAKANGGINRVLVND